MTTRLIEKLSDVLPGGSDRYYYRCELGHVSYDSRRDNLCYRCGSERRFHEPRRDEWATRWAIWKLHRKWLPRRRYGRDKMWWEWMGRRLAERSRQWF